MAANNKVVELIQVAFGLGQNDNLEPRAIVYHREASEDDGPGTALNISARVKFGEWPYVVDESVKSAESTPTGSFSALEFFPNVENLGGIIDAHTYWSSGAGWDLAVDVEDLNHQGIFIVDFAGMIDQQGFGFDLQARLLQSASTLITAKEAELETARQFSHWLKESLK